MRAPSTAAALSAVLSLSLSLAACGAPSTSGPGGAKPFTSTEKAEVATATAAYTRFVQGELAGLVTQTGQFVTAVKAGDDDKARSIYPNARARWERVETIASEFGHLDPAIDAREAG